MKRIAVKISGSEREPVDLQIQPGTTAGEVLRQVGLMNGYFLSRGPNENRFFGTDEEIYSKVSDGDKLFALSKAEVGLE